MTTTTENEIVALQVLLASDDYFDMRDIGVEWDGWQTVAAEAFEPRRWFRTVHVVTRSPEGNHYRWAFEEALTEYQEDERPDTTIVPVTLVEEVITFGRWVAKED